MERGPRNNDNIQGVPKKMAPVNVKIIVGISVFKIRKTYTAYLHKAKLFCKTEMFF